MAKYGAAASKAVKKAVKKQKAGKLKSGRSGATVKSRKQAIAIGLSEARRKGGKVPPVKAKKAAKSATRKAVAKRKPARKTAKKKPSRSR